MIRLSSVGLCLLAALAAGCGNTSTPTDASEAASSNAVAEQAAAEAEARLTQAEAEENWSLAKAHADVLLATHPGTAAADRVQARFADIQAKAEAAKREQRMQALWSYTTEAVGAGKQLSAAIYAENRLDTGNGQSSTVRLIFRDHPEWGRSSYLVLESGDFACRGGCTLAVQADEDAPTRLPGSRPDTDEAIAMFIEDEKALWRLADAAQTLTITVPVQGLDPQPARFEVGGLDAAQLPGWP